MTNHIERIRRALQVLWDHHHFWNSLSIGAEQRYPRRYLADKAQAIVKHDRILRGAA
ncbi:hypothetical protein [Pseudomonas typographi]|uniref:hypothetical protein n=1 Tax=Pseudomonas typographi TaxID=2715964 RepID=UPI001686731C|nr:hypothetical protein [Pseudomonas typographi]MBD1590233.1 hypothetical protein [Pseudomonas typographi]